MKPALAALMGVLLWLSGVAVWIEIGPPEDANDTADTAIVLGAAVNGDKPSPVFAARIDHAIALYQAGRVSHLIFTGARSPEDTKSEAQAAKDYAQGQGVPESAIFIEDVSRTTYENLIEARRLMGAQDLNSALIVSDPFHLRRALLMASSLEIEAQASATPTSRYQSWSTKGPFLLRELYFVHNYWVFGQ